MIKAFLLLRVEVHVDGLCVVLTDDGDSAAAVITEVRGNTRELVSTMMGKLNNILAMFLQ